MRLSIYWHYIISSKTNWDWADLKKIIQGVEHGTVSSQL